MYLVVLKWVTGDDDTICIVAETKEKAQEYINQQTEGYMPSGLGYYKIVEVKKYI